jgi:hypothetical protein
MPWDCIGSIRQRRDFLVVSFAVAAVGALAWGAGIYACAPASIEGCTANGTCAPEADGATADSPSSDSAIIIPWDGQDPTRLADGGSCDPTKSPHDEPCVIDEAYGVFVAPSANGGSDTTGDGSKMKPFASIGHALSRLGAKRRVYLCDGTYSESVTVQTAASLYGGLACQGGDSGTPWSYDLGTATLSGAHNQVPLVVNEAGAVSVEDMSIVAANGSGHDDAGNGLSSIAALVNGSTVAFRRCTFNAGTGDNGGEGVTGVNYTGATAAPGEANDGGVGGAGGVATCNDGTSSFGGAGGGTQSTSGVNGGARPMSPVTAPFDGMGAPGGSVTCGNGNPGGNGAAGDAGTAPSTFGTLTASGWTPSAGGAGDTGRPGQGGGGGEGKTMLGGTGGGAGGCGGAGGAAGGGGGASIALASVGATITLDGCMLATSAAGSGGKGSDGQPGQGGGVSPGVTGVCAGGFGGNGAGGAGGAGGTGGISVCVVYQGALPSGSFTCSHGSAGQPGNYGRGGPGGDTSPTQGNPGVGGPSGSDGGLGLGQGSLQTQ